MKEGFRRSASGFRICVLRYVLSVIGIARKLRNAGSRIPVSGRVGLLDSELLSCIGAETFGGPRWSPNDIHSAVTDAGELFDAGFNLGADVDVLGAALRGEGHFDGNILLRSIGILGRGGGKIHFVDEAKVDDVDRNLRIVATLESAQDVLFVKGWHEAIPLFQFTLWLRSDGLTRSASWKLDRVLS